METGAIFEKKILEPEEAAADWHARLANGADTRAELEFMRWRDASAENREAYDRLSSRHDGIRALADVPEMLSMRHQTLLRLTVKQRHDKQVRKAIGAALAVLVVMAPFVAMRFGLFSPSPPVVTADAGGVEGQTFRTAVGQRSTITLADGSRVTLNTASRIRVAYTKGDRQVMLDEGQVWFEVAKDNARRFVVHAGGQRVEALGTKFDVRVMPDRTEVMLAEGRVTVASERPGRGGASVAMQPSELLVASAGGTTVNHVTNPDAWRNWRQGFVIFDNMPLARAVGEMNRYSETQLRVADAATGQIVISGGFNAGATGAFVEALAVGFKVSSRKDAAGNIVLSHTR